MGAAPGARILRSDVLRKRLAHVPPEQKLPESLYSPLASQTVYRLLVDLAGRHLTHGTAVIADSVASRLDERASMAQAALHARAPFIGLWLEASEDIRLARVCGRGADASDADAGVVVAQSEARSPPPADWERLAAGLPLADVVASARRVIREALPASLS